MFAFVERLWLAIYLVFQNFWIGLNKTIVQAIWLAEPRSAGFHKVVIIGDEFGNGLGDWVTFGTIAGVVRHLQPLLMFDQDKIKLRWKFYSAAKSGTVSDDWLPDKPLFRNTFTHKAFKDAEIVMVWVGSGDRSPGPKHQFPAGTVKNLANICDTLMKDGKRVILAGLPCTGAETATDDQATWNKEANQMLQDYVSRTQEKQNDGEAEKLLSFGPLLQGAKYGRGTSQSTIDGLFSSAGYKMAAKDIYDTVFSQMKAVEWEVLQQHLSRASTETKKSK